MLSDTHCHLDLKKFDPDRGAVLERAIQAGVNRILIPGLSLASSLSAVKLAESHPLLFAAVGVHPTEAERWTEETSNKLRGIVLESGGLPPTHGRPSVIHRNLESSGLPPTEEQTPVIQKKIVAIGEIGLDYYWDSAPHLLQQDVLLQQLALAAELQLPVVIHFREKADASPEDCASDLMKILQEWVTGLRRENSPLVSRSGVLH